MSPLPHVLAACAVSLDGHLDDRSSERLLLSNAEDFDLVDGLRASCDAILVGAATVRADDPRLVVRSDKRHRERITRGLPPDPMKVTVTRSTELDPQARFFTVGESLKLVYAPLEIAGALERRLGERAAVVGSEKSAEIPIDFLLADLAERGVERLMIEGGTRILTAFLTAGRVDELQISIAPFFVGDPEAPRFVSGGRFPHDKDHRMVLEKVRQLGDMAVLNYRLARRG